MRRKLFLGLLLAALAGSIALALHNHFTADDDEQQFIPIASKMTPEIERLQRYVRVDTSNPPGRERAGADFLAELLAQNGVTAEIIESAPGRANVYARLSGKTPGEGLLLLSHIDVVPSDGKAWTHPPFAAKVAFNQMYGRGTLDMKGIAMCELEAFIAVARSGRKPERDIVFLATSDEEEGGAMGLEWLLAHRPHVAQGVRYVLNEGGITETKQERISYFGIEIGTKMMVKVQLRSDTRAQMAQARIALEPYIGSRDPDRVLPEVREFLRDVAPNRIEYRPLLEDIDHTIALGKLWLLPRGYRELVQNTLWPRAVTEAGGEAAMEVAMHNLPDEDPDQRIAWLASVVRPYGVTIGKVTRRTGPAPMSSRHTPMFALLRREINGVYGTVPVGTEIIVNSVNDSRFLRARGIQCYGLWPFPVDFFQSQGIHGIDERVRLDWYMDGVRLMKRVVDHYAFDPRIQ